MEYIAVIESSVMQKEVVQFEIKRGDSLHKVVQRLSEKKILDKPTWFRIHSHITGSSRKLKAGEYDIKPGTSLRELLNIMVSGNVRQYSLTLLEGWTFKQVITAIAKHVAIKHTIVDLNGQQIMHSLNAGNSHPEGLFFPDTYFFTKDTSDIDFLKRSYLKMQNELATEWENRNINTPLKSAYDALILASIIEKETGQTDERTTIAGVFIRRLQKGMRLQTDPTVIYGMGENYQGNIRYKDLRRDTPYNTYLHAGLPPTPIAMPSKDSIHAALHPAAGTSLYFVSRGDGSHVFSTTLKEHNRAVDIFQRKKKRK